MTAAGGAWVPHGQFRDVPSEDALRTLLGAGQLRVLDAVRDSSEPVDIQQIAQAVGRHVNTVRFHIDRLADAGLLVRLRRASTGPGRPRFLYATSFPRAERDDARVESYRLLTQVLSTLVEREVRHAKKAAISAGRDVGHELTASTVSTDSTGANGSTGGSGDTGTILAGVSAAMAGIGFVSSARSTTAEDGRPELVITECPFRDLARTHPLVCDIHRGMLEGALSAMSTSAQVSAQVIELRPFAEAESCVARLATGQDRERSRSQIRERSRSAHRGR